MQGIFKDLFGSQASQGSILNLPAQSAQATLEQNILKKSGVPMIGASSGLFQAMGMNFNITDAISFLALISPFLLAFLMVMISIINSNVKGLIYLLGLVILFVIDGSELSINLLNLENLNTPSNLSNSLTL